MKKLITTSRKQTYSPILGIRGFETYLNRRLTKNERKVISYLERQKRARPVLVIDPPGRNSAPILQQYLNYRLAKGPSQALGAIYTPTRLKGKERRIKYLTYRRPDSIRGHTLAYILLLNTQDAKTFSPLQARPDGFLRLWNALLPALSGCGFFIVHITAPRTRGHADKLARLFGRRMHRILKPDTDRKSDEPPPTIVITLPVRLPYSTPTSPTTSSPSTTPPHPL
ncbi:MAG: hypothetical protein NC039_02320 [Muribaculaceae bacterium]|nr:hypothetical protein [Muribaculaceae bacterium]